MGRLGVVASPLGLVALLVACADLHSPPPAASVGAAGADGTSSRGGTGAGHGGGAGAESGSAASSSTGQGGGASASSAGVPGLGGSSGSNGTGGASGQAGIGGTTVLPGASGDGGASGGAGGAGGETDCARRDDGDIHAWLYQEITAEKSNEIHPFIALTNKGLNVPLNQLAIRYYFSGEAAGDWELACLWVTKAGDTDHGFCDEGVSVQIVALDPPRAQADQYLEISFSGVTSAGLSDGFPIEARTMFWRAGHPMLNLANDYSFVPNLNPVLNEGPRAYKQTSKVTVYRNGALVWGEEPCP